MFFLCNVSHCARFTAEIDVGSIRCGCVLALFTGIQLQQLCSDLGGPALFFFFSCADPCRLIHCPVCLLHPPKAPPSPHTSPPRYQSRKRRVGRRARRIVYCYVAIFGPVPLLHCTEMKKKKKGKKTRERKLPRMKCN